MEHHDLTDELGPRLRAARPASARVDHDAFDGALLARVRQQPIAPRRSVPRAVAMPLAAGVIVAATAAVMLGGIPGNVAGPPSADAITQETLHWLTPPAGTVLHVRSVETRDGLTTTREFWQSADDPNAERELVVQGAQSYETSGDAIYDPATNTIYDAPQTPPAGGEVPSSDPKGAPAKPEAPADTSAAEAAKAEQAKGPAAADAVKAAQAASDSKVHGAGKGRDGMPAGDPIVAKVRSLLGDGRMEVSGRGLHDGVDAWAISLKPEFTDLARPGWTLWVSVADGKPLELRDPGEAGGQVIDWPVYETLEGDTAAQLATLEGAHPSAQVLHDPAQLTAAWRRLLPSKP
jgi:hypothetical protein